MTEPINCPLCDGAAICDAVEHGYYQVFCRSVLTCGAAGSPRPEREDAIGMWNRRAGQQVAATEPPLSWRCFHCEYVARTREQAIAHFGPRMNERPAICLPTAPAGARMPEFPEPIGYESPVLKIIYTPDDNPEDKSLPVFSKEQVLALILAARAALAAAPGARQPLSDAEIDAMFSRWAIGTGDVKHMYRAGFRHAVRDLESEHGITLAPIAGKGDGNG